MRENATSERIQTHPGIKVKSGKKLKAVPSHEKSGNLQILSLVRESSRKIASLFNTEEFYKLRCMKVACQLIKTCMFFIVYFLTILNIGALTDPLCCTGNYTL